MLIIAHAGNRPDSMSYKVALIYQQLLKKKGIEAGIFSLQDLPAEFLEKEMKGEKSREFQKMVAEKIVPEQKFVVIMPEYNGSIPGLLKVFIDACDVDTCFRGKKAALVGISAGRAGNLRGLDHLTDIFHHMGTEVLSNKIPISSIKKVLTQEGKFESSSDTEKVLEKQIEQFIKF